MYVKEIDWRGTAAEAEDQEDSPYNPLISYSVGAVIGLFFWTGIISAAIYTFVI